MPFIQWYKRVRTPLTYCVNLARALMVQGHFLVPALPSHRTDCIGGNSRPRVRNELKAVSGDEVRKAARDTLCKLKMTSHSDTGLQLGEDPLDCLVLGGRTSGKG